MAIPLITSVDMKDYASRADIPMTTLVMVTNTAGWANAELPGDYAPTTMIFTRFKTIP